MRCSKGSSGRKDLCLGKRFSWAHLCVVSLADFCYSHLHVADYEWVLCRYFLGSIYCLSPLGRLLGG